MSLRHRGLSLSGGLTKLSSMSKSTYAPSHTATSRDSRKARVENSYRTQPTDTFPVVEVRSTVTETLENTLTGMSYEAREMQDLITELTTTIRDKVKDIGCPRYKIVVFVTITKSGDPSVKVASRCVWNQQFDRYVDCSYQTNELHASAVVFAIYQE